MTNPVNKNWNTQQELKRKAGRAYGWVDLVAGGRFPGELVLVLGRTSLLAASAAAAHPSDFSTVGYPPRPKL